MVTHCQDRVQGAKKGSIGPARRITIVFLCILTGIVAGGFNPVQAQLDLADHPLMAQIKPAPASIMILLDDSGSMSCETLAEEDGGYFPNPDGTDFCYIFDLLGDSQWRGGNEMEASDRKYWKSQSSNYNLMYYNPAVTYFPWPSYSGHTFPDADPENSWPNPLETDTRRLDLDGESFSVALEGGGTLVVKNAHYFLESGSDVYLIVLDGRGEGQIISYKVTARKGDGLAQTVERVQEMGDLPSEISAKNYGDERQNFANWFTYHRRREYVAKNAVARVILKMEGVRVGLLGINGTIILPLKPVGVQNGLEYQDETDDVLEALYDYSSDGVTPLREGLNDVGKYFKDNNRSLVHYKGESVSGDAAPYFTEAEGGACQQSFTIIMTDGYYSYERTIDVGNADEDDTDNPYDGGFYQDDLSNTLADVAMYYYKNDLSPDAEDSPAGDGLPDKVYISDLVQQNALDTAPHQHMVSYGVAFGVTGDLDPADYNDDPTSEDYLKCINAEKCTVGDYPQWPDSRIGARTPETVDDLFHATVNGRGKFLTARDPQALTKALSNLVDNIISRLGSSSSVTINGDALYGRISDEVLLFQASYKTSDWSGDVRAYGVDTGIGEVVVDNPKWSAADSLNDKAWDDRTILSYDGESGTVFSKTTVTNAQKTLLGADYNNLIEYVKGNEIDGFRTRTSKLGDIVHSSPVFEKDVVFVGANDGMLHAFKITVNYDGSVSGDEIFGYVPNLVYANLGFLADPVFNHKFFVDLTPVVKEGKGLLGGEISKTILVGGLGKGGKGYFALDITNPAAMDEEDVLWEFPNDNTTEDDKKDMGYSFGKPVVARTNSTNPDESWVVIAPNGYDSENGQAALFILRPGKPATGQNIVIRKIVADIPEISDETNGLSSPIAIDVNFDQKVDFVYAGDLYGNMWKFDLTAESASQWNVAYHDGSNAQPLFKARGPGGSVQPITSKPEVMFHPREHGLMVLFGTGKFLGKTDFEDASMQSVYGIWDYGDRIYHPGEWGDYSNDDDSEYLGAFTRPGLSKFSSNVTLQAQTSSLHSVTVDGEVTNVRVFSSNELIWNTTPDTEVLGLHGEPNLPDIDDTVAGHAGWYYDLSGGERVVSDVLLRDGRLIVIGFTPSPDPCSAGGTSFFMELDSSTGGVAGGTLFDINDDGVIDERDMVVTGEDDQGNEILGSPQGVDMPGNLQPPAILQLNPKIEVKYISSSTGAIYTLKEKAVRLGVAYWKEVERGDSTAPAAQAAPTTQ
jgi:type IV pilus assembly protein PilY1